MASGIIDGLLAGSTPGGAVEVDGHRNIGSKLPVNFFPEASAISKEGRENLVPYADHTFNALGPDNDLVEQGRCKAAECTEWATAKCQRDALKSSDVTIGCSTIPEASRVMLCFGGKPRSAPLGNPDEFDLSRDPSGHLSFGMRIHQCVGQHAARLQAASLLEQLVPRIKSIELASAIERHYNNTLRGWDSVPLRLTLA